MKIITKRRNWWKRPLAVMLSATLVASSFSMVGMPREVQAATVGPGGVSSVDFVSHVDVGKSAVEKTTNQYVLNDLAGNFEWTHSSLGNSSDAIKGVINYHPAISGENGVLFVTKKGRVDISLPTKQEREIFSVQKSAGQGFPWEFGENANQGVKYADDKVTVSFGLTRNIDGPVTFTPKEKVSFPNILNVSTANTDWNLSINGRTEQKKILNQPFSWIGTDDKVYGSEYLGYGSYSSFKDGSIAEMLVFNRKLTNDERQKVNSYLALKYGITLKDDSGVTTDYIASNDSTMWTATKNSGFGHRVTGIGRDDNGLLNQKQSKSQADGANVTIALGDVALSNAANTNEIDNNFSFFTFSDDNQPADYTKVLTNAELPSQLQHTNTDTKSTKMMERVYKVDKSSNWEDALITLQVDGANPNEFQLYLFTSSDPTFATGVTVTPAHKTTGKAQTNTSFLTDGSYFTFVKYVDKKTLETRVSEIDAENLQAASYTPVSWQAFAQALVNAKAVLTDADKTASEVTAALTALNVARTGLKQPIVDKSALEAKVAEIEGENLDENAYTPESWQELQDKLTAAETILNDPDATQQQVDDALDALNKAYNDLDLLPPAPTVDKSLLKARVSIVEGLTESDYTADSWAGLEPELTDAINVLNNPNATQQDIDDAYNALKVKHDALEFSDPNAEVDKSALDAKVAEINGENLDEHAYTPESWQAFQGKLSEAQAVLDNDTAKQADVNEALTQLIAAREALTLVPVVPEVDKSALQAKVDAVTGENLNGTNYTPASWQALQNALVHAQTVLDDPNATQTEVDAALAKLTSARNGLRTVDHSNNGQLILLVPSFGSLSPSFSSDHYEYSLSVGYGVSQLPLSATAFDPNATMEMSVNGQLVTNGEFPLVVGRNVIVITVTDSQGNKAVYTLIVTRQSSSGGGGGGTSEPSTPTPSDPNKETIIVDLEIDGDNPLERTRVTIERTKEANGQIHDFVALTPAQAQEAVDKAKQIGNDIARIVIPDVKDEVDRVTIEVSQQSIQILRDNGISLEISTDNAHLALPVSSMEGIDDSFYFRLVPVKKEHERNEIEERARVEQVVREAMQSDEINVVARPMTIETNLSSRPVILTLPLKGVDLPANPTERQAYVNRLGVFIEHSDGEKKVVFGEIVTMANGELGIRFSINKFSTFTIIHFGDQDHHDAYLKGFPDGFFKPNEAVTRAQVAAMVARNLGYTGSERASIAPFKDVAPSHYASGVIGFVKEAGIMTGDHNGQFRPNDTITRAEMATVIANYKQLTIQTNVAPSFNDTKGHWAEATIEATRQAGLVTGYEDGRFAPNGSLTRAEAVVMMNRMFERGPLHGVAKSSFPDVHPNHWAFKDIEEAATTHLYYTDENGKEHVTK